MKVTTIGLLHPGEMGAAIGAQLQEAGHRVLWSSERRGPQSARRAAEAGLEDVGSAQTLAAQSEFVLSVAPPAAACQVAESIGAYGGIYVDANAIAPATTRAVGQTVTAAGGRYVDGGIIGAPPRRPDQMRLYLSGPEAAAVAELFAGTAVDARTVGDRIGDASAIKVAYAGWTKGSKALLLAMREFAAREGVEETLLAEWDLSQPDLGAAWDSAARSRDEKGWR
jgi:3-hydroxyisobutyrate dehydrogenase-like beta-hydroxyacid dehydrogenase